MYQWSSINHRHIDRWLNVSQIGNAKPIENFIWGTKNSKKMKVN